MDDDVLVVVLVLVNTDQDSGFRIQDQAPHET